MASLDFEHGGDVHRLEGSSGQERGGLVIMKKKTSGEGHTFKKPDAPKVSLFGLDKLAALKRQTEGSEGNATPKRSKVSSYDDEEDDVEDERTSSDGNKGSKERLETFVFLFVSVFVH
jgi:hypothetical protein